MLCFVRCCQRHCIKYCSFNLARTPRMYSKQYFRVKKRLTIMSTLSFQSIHMEHGGGLILSRKLPAIAIRNEMIIVGGESDCNYSTGNALKKQKIEHLLAQNQQQTPSLGNREESKRVRFYGKVKVVLVPSLEEYKQANLDSLLWWNSSDYAFFKDSAVADVKRFLRMNSNLDARRALSLLLQEEVSREEGSLLSNFRMSSSKDEPVLYESPPVACR